jgi:RNA polymerase sigma-70 factor (ECF subfamily)
LREGRCDHRATWCILKIVNPPSAFQRDVDPALIGRLQRGDLAAFETVYRDFERAAWTLALRLTGHADAAHEVLQDAMLKAWQRAAQYRGDAPFWAWLRRLVVNEALMRLRRERVRAAEPFEDVYADERGAMPWSLVDAAALDRALCRLPDTARAVLWLYHVEGYTHIEIAAQFGRTESFSKSQLARGTRRLRELLQPTVETTPCMIGTTTTA